MIVDDTDHLQDLPRKHRRRPRRIARDASLDDAIERFLNERLDVVDRRRPLGEADVRVVNGLLARARRPMSRAQRHEITPPFAGAVAPGEALVALLKVRFAMNREYERLLAALDDAPAVTPPV